jgi:hypothetical protein
MQTLLHPMKYPAEIRNRLRQMPPLATEIANRWMLGWPQRVADLLEAGQFLPALIAQEKAEREALAQPGNAHLARHEISQLYGLTMEPPALTA